MSDWQERYAETLMNSYGPPKLELARGDGAHVWDSEGREYVDFLGGIAVNALGHAHPALVSAVTTQLQTLGHVSNFFATEPQIRLAERLLDMVGRPGRVFFANSGAEANEAALKATRRTGRSHVVATEAGFHGRTLGALSLTHKPAAREPFEPLPGDVTFVPYGDAEALSAAVGDHTAAVVLEPIQGEAGVVPAPPGYLAHAREVTRAHGALLWLDEVQTGIGRTGAWLAHQLLEPDLVGEAAPDLVTLAKGLAGGMPIGACVAIGEAGELLGPGSHGTTFGGNPVSAAAAHAVLDTIGADDLMAHATRLGQVLRDGLGADDRVVAVRGHGLLVGLELSAEAGPAVVQAAQDAGFILNATGPTRIRLAPPLVLTDADAEALVTAWPAILDSAGVGGAGVGGAEASS